MYINPFIAGLIVGTGFWFVLLVSLAIFKAMVKR